MVALLVAVGVSLIASLAGTPVLIRSFQARGVGQQIREEGPEGHFTKAGTPTMGGIAMVGAAGAGYIASHFRTGAVFTAAGGLVLLTVLATGSVGLLDDWLKVSRRQSLGLNKRAKFGAQLMVSGAFAFFAVAWARMNTDLSFTRSLGIGMNNAIWVVWAVTIIIGASNAVNLADGLDGLAAGSSAFAFAAFVFIGFWEFRHQSVYHVGPALDLAVLAAAMAGSCAGFLWWNAAPARIFMGDTGSLAIGAGLGALALATNTQLLLPIICGLFVIVTLSVVIQVGAFRLFHRRVFRMAPIHHHFELLGWPETTVIVRFWILAALSTAIAMGSFYADFLSGRRL